MVDCGSLRCAQERRSLRRDLQSLSKKLPVILGLESIAAVFAKGDGEQTPPEQPKQCESRTKDFQLSNRCFYCEKKLPNIYKRINRIVNDAQRGKENKGKICLRSLQDLIPFCLEFYTHGFGRELFSECVKNYFTSSPADNGSDSKTSSVPSGSHELSHPLSIPSTSYENTRSSKHLPSHSKASGQHVNGMEEKRIDRNRDAAVSLMHCLPESVLDTMAVKQEPDSFGEREFVPSEEADLYHAFFNHLTGLSHRDTNPFLDYKDLSFPFALQNLFLNSTLPHSTYSSPDSSSLLKELHLAQIRRMHNLDGINRKQPRPAHGNQLKMPILINVVRKMVHKRFMEIKMLHRNGRPEMIEESDEEEENFAAPFASMSPFSAALSAYPRSKHNFLNGGNFSNSTAEDILPMQRFGKVNECSRIGDTLKDIIVKGITEKVRPRDCSSDENSCPSSPNISGKRQLGKSGLSSYYNSVPSLFSKSLKSEGGTSRMDGDYGSPPKRFKKDGMKSKSVSKKSIPTVGSPPNVKKTRPKRGQYRKYNSQLLMDAVRAVQSGEMSVHRAGSFFGVPHSTLEYKVKERHLLRQRKGKESTAGSFSKTDHPLLKLTIDLSRESSPTPSDGTVASSRKPDTPCSPTSSVGGFDGKKTSLVLSDQAAPDGLPSASALSSSSPCASSSQDNNEGKQPAISSSSPVTWLQPYLSGSSSSASTRPEPFHHHHPPPPLPNVPLDNSASELLRKLQHKVQTSKSFLTENVPALPFVSKEPVFTLDGGAAGALAGRFPVFNQSS